MERRRDSGVAGADLDYHNPGSESSLSKAVRSGRLSLVKKLVSRGRNPDVADNRGWTALHHAAVEESLDPILAFLLERGAFVEHRSVEGESPLFLAAARGNLPGVVTLLAHGADLRSRTSEGQTPLHAAAFSTSDVKVLRHLLSVGADPHAEDADGFPPLYTAVEEKNLSAVRVLLEVTTLKLKSEEDSNILLYCIARGSPAIFRAVAEWSEEVTVAAREFSTKEGWTLLMEAVQGREAETVEWLLGAGASPGKRDRRGVTALHVAAHSPDPRSFPLLLRAVPPLSLLEHSAFETRIASPPSLPGLLMDADSLDNLRLLLETPGIPHRVLVCPVKLQSRTVSPAGFLLYRCPRVDQKRKIQFLQLLMEKQMPLDVVTEPGYMTVVEAVVTGHKAHVVTTKGCQCVQALVLAFSYRCQATGTDTLAPADPAVVLPLILDTFFPEAAVILVKHPHIVPLHPDRVIAAFVQEVLSPTHRFCPDGDEALFLKALLPLVSSFEKLRLLTGEGERGEEGGAERLEELRLMAWKEWRRIPSLKRLARGVFLEEWATRHPAASVADLLLPRPVLDYLRYRENGEFVDC